MYKIGVLGDRDSIYGFAALGLEVFPVSTPEDGARALRNLCDQNYGIVYITEAMAEELAPELERCRENLLPAVIPIPGVHGNTGLGINMVKRSVEQAVGSDINFNQK